MEKKAKRGFVGTLVARALGTEIAERPKQDVVVKKQSGVAKALGEKSDLGNPISSKYSKITTKYKREEIEERRKLAEEFLANERAQANLNRVQDYKDLDAYEHETDAYRAKHERDRINNESRIIVKQQTLAETKLDKEIREIEEGEQKKPTDFKTELAERERKHREEMAIQSQQAQFEADKITQTFGNTVAKTKALEEAARMAIDAIKACREKYEEECKRIGIEPDLTIIVKHEDDIERVYDQLVEQKTKLNL